MAVERKLGPFMTKQGEFYYSKKEEGKSVFVRKEQEYFSNMTHTKRIYYELKSTGERIVKVVQDNNIIAAYARSWNQRQRDQYPKNVFPTSRDLVNSGDIIKRTFALNKISDSKEIFEVDSSTNSTIHIFVKLNWKIGGKLEDAIRYNEIQVNKAEKRLPGIKEILPLDQLHKTKIESLLGKKPTISNEVSSQQQTNNSTY